MERSVRALPPILTATTSILALALAGPGCSSSGADSGSTTPGGGTFSFMASGEVLASTGYDFDPAGDPVFVDGWSIKFTKLLVAIGKVTLSDGPDTDPNDQSKVGGVVAEVDGPWVMDLASSTKAVDGIGDPGVKAIPFATLENQNKKGNAAFAADTRYAFGFSTVAATASAAAVNLDATDPDFVEMASKGYSVFYIGTATWEGDKGGNACKTPMGSTYDWSQVPKMVSFRLGFNSPSDYVNCQNSELPAIEGSDDHQRGVQVKANESLNVQVTIHTDHPFWDSFAEDSPLHFDQLAAQLIGAAAPTATTEMLAGVPFQPMKDKTGASFPWRYCKSDEQMDQVDKTFLTFDPQTVTVADYQKFFIYSQSTQGHLNADGLCFVSRNFTP